MISYPNCKVILLSVLLLTSSFYAITDANASQLAVKITAIINK